MVKTIKNINKNVEATYSISVKGIVQGVGFRPFIWRLARESGLYGSVCNTTEGVLIKINIKDKKKLMLFIKKIKQKKPSPALIEEIAYEKSDYKEFSNFTISDSIRTENRFQLVSPDLAACSSCIHDIMDEKNSRRYSYPFTNCTNCGPRFTIIKKMPYDRQNTTMKKFGMCPECSKEYNDPSDRRFHAQPNACKLCGPTLSLTDKNGNMIICSDPVYEASELLHKGKIIGIKSLGGFQIACDATNDYSVMQLRKKKKRPSKPFAIMFRDLKMASAYYKLNKAQIQSLKSPGAPVLLVKKNPGTAARHISDRVSGFNNYEGIMIAYTPLHHLLFKNIDVPLVMTSGNVSEEPIASENNEAINKLGGICDYFLTNNRDIFSKYDDSVIRIIGNREASIRRARGYAPYPIKIECDAGKNPVLATGAQEKNTFCLLYSNFAIISQHLGDMDNAETVHFFKDTLENYMKIFGLPGLRMVVHDCHPGYATTDFAKSFMPSAQKLAVQHHKAHIASVIAENRLLNDMKNDFIGFAWDGTGYGDDGKIWGSEVFTVNRKLEFKRISHLAEKVLPGGEATIKNPYRMSLVYLYNFWKKVICSPADLKSADLKIDFNRYVYNEFPHYKEIIPLLEMQLVTRQIETGFNSPLTTSMGRLFDAVSSLLNLIHVSTYEGEAAVRLEMAASGTTGKQYTLCLVENNNELIIDDFHLFNQIVADIKNNIAVSIISSKFHNSLAHLILHTCRIHREKSGIDTVLLSGGVFQNHLLLTKTARILKKEGFKVYSNNKVPVNDGGISLGQAFIAAVAQDCKNKI